VLFFTRRGMGPFCYGDGTSQNPPPTGMCYDPADASKGNHAYPYESWVYAYDANALLSVKTGAKQRWEITPYATWKLALPFPAILASMPSVTFDPSTRRLFIVASYSDGAAPLVHVYTVK
jgi:hypothetical protein